MFYDRKIKYLDYYEDGERVKGGGFVKLEARDNLLRMDVMVSGLYAGDFLTYDIILLSSGQESVIGRITISGGKGQYRQLYYDLDNIGGTGIRYRELQGIRIPMGASRELSCSWPTMNGHEQKASTGRTAQNTSATQPTESGNRTALWEVVMEASGGDAIQQNKMPDMSTSEKKPLTGISDLPNKNTHNGSEINSSEINSSKSGSSGNNGSEINSSRNSDSKNSSFRNDGSGNNSSGNGSSGQERRGNTGHMETPRPKGSRRYQAEIIDTLQEKRIQRENAAEGGTARPNREPQRESGEEAPASREQSGQKQKDADRRMIRLLEDKWMQLCAIYPHIHPFRDKREYLSIGPGDFVLFPAASYKMINNSFLLHGYYNYNHLILTRVEQKGEPLYYIGVPGNYYEKEKQVAIMFGFESFECEEEPAQIGDFGYYMMRTQL